VRYREIISYQDMGHREKISLQKGMNFRVGRGAGGVHSNLSTSVGKGLRDRPRRFAILA